MGKRNLMEIVANYCFSCFANFYYEKDSGDFSLGDFRVANGQIIVNSLLDDERSLLEELFILIIQAPSIVMKSRFSRNLDRIDSSDITATSPE